MKLHKYYSIDECNNEEALFEKLESLKNDGKILITLGTSGEEYSEEKNWAGTPTMAWSQYDPETYIQILDETGFDIIDSEFEGKKGEAEHHFWVLAKKI